MAFSSDPDGNPIPSDQWTLVENGSLSVYTNDEGHLVCSRHGEKICAHVSEVMDNAFDADQVWANPTVQVPLFGLEDNSGIWVQIELKKMDTDSTFKRIFLWVGTQYEYVGILTHGEGRKAIRNQCAVYIQNIYLSEPADAGLKCISTAHSFERQRELMNIMARGPERDDISFWSNYWTLKMDHVCVACLKPDFSADIPGSERNWN